ncbi:MAG: HEAT repeat domain-containing protein [Gemmatimonadaceae bacterium]|nr:HEAT repeat domain-containing protein [Gemmatimonadaceae bacterium]
MSDLAELDALMVMAGAEMAQVGNAFAVQRAIEAHATTLAAQSSELAAHAVQFRANAAVFGVGAVGGQYVSDPVASVGWEASSASYRTQAPASWDSQDPADSLYREARRALGSDNYPIAAMAFRKIREQYPKSTYTADAYYWEAFAMQRIGQKASLVSALELLGQQQEKHPRASTRGDASSLKTRIEGQLARLGDQQAIASLADKARNATSDGCPRAQDDERIDALNAVAQMEVDQALPILRKVLTRREPCTQQLRRTAVWLVASKRPADAASMLLNVAKSDPDKEVREQAVFWMANVPTEEATTMLIDLAKKGEDLDLQKRALYSLSRSKSPRAASTLKEVAMDASANVELRGDALNWYMNGPGRTSEDALTFLKDVYGRADEGRFKQRVLQMIAMRKNDETRAFLTDVAQNSRESIDTRRSALYALSSAGASSTQLAQIYDRSMEVEFRQQVISALSSLRENAGIEKLIDIARNDKNAQLRKQAVSHLSRSKDPRALQLLTEIINR